MKASEFDKIFDEGKEDITQYLDLGSARLINPEPKRLNIDIPPWMVAGLDKESTRLGVTRQSLIKMWLAERLDHIHAAHSQK